jgi:hypothetical protein
MSTIRRYTLRHQPAQAVKPATRLNPKVLFDFRSSSTPSNIGSMGSGLAWATPTNFQNNQITTYLIGLRRTTTGVAGHIFGSPRSLDGFAPASSPCWFAWETEYAAFTNQGSSANILWGYATVDSGTGFYAIARSTETVSVALGNTELAGPTCTPGRIYRYVAGRDADGNCWLWRDGDLVASGTGATAADSAVARKLILCGDDTGTQRNYNGNISVFALGSGNPQSFGAQFSRNPWAYLFTPTPKRIWVPSAVGGATNLVIQDAAHAHAADNITLTSATALAISDASHSHAADNIGLTTSTALAVADSSHAHAADNISLTVAAALVVADASHAHTADNITLTSATALAPADALHGHAADNLTLDVSGAANLVIQDAAHAQVADSVTLTSDSLLVVADSLHAHAADNVSLSTSWLLTIADALHSHAADQVTLSAGPTLEVSDGAHGHSAEQIILTSASQLAIADARHTHAAENVVLGVAGVTNLEVQDGMHAHSAANVVLALDNRSFPPLAPRIQGQLRARATQDARRSNTQTTRR